jgi:formamidopyrimidine-DNA glycosylase
MPELPEVETMVRGIRPAVEGRTIAQVRRCRCRYKPIEITPGFGQFQRRLQGRSIQRVRRLAKRVVLETDAGDACVIEPRMTGLMLLANPPDRTHLRLEWELEGTDNAVRLWFWDRRGLGTVRLYRADEFQSELGPQKLGPDALEITEPQWRERLDKTARAVKVVLLDQKVVAGIGNLYASEILHRAGLSPLRRASELKSPEIRRLHQATRDVLTQAIHFEGSTLADGTYRNALSQNGGYQNEHRVYDKTGARCSRCRRAEIVRIVQAQRSTFFCPRCQK